MSSETNLQLFPGVFRSTQGGANPDFFLHSSGRVGIGNDAPEVSTVANGNTRFKLNVTGHTRVDGNLDVTGSVYGDGSNMTGVALPWVQSTPNVGTDIKYEGGNVGIGSAAGTERLKVNGDILATGNVTAYSDRRLKSDIVKLKDALNKIDKLNGYTYVMNDKPSTGLIAQEVLEVLPEVVHGSEETTYSLAYGNMSGIIIEAIKELREKVLELENKIQN